MTPPRILARDFHFPECPRWHDGRLWLSDMHGHCVMTVDAAGRTEVVARLPTQPAGLGWTPDGLAMIPWGGLVWILWRGAPMRPAQAGAIAGVASLLLAAAGMRTMCVVDERLHLAVWHALPVAVGAIGSTGVTLMLLRRRKRRRDGSVGGMLEAR